MNISTESITASVKINHPIGSAYYYLMKNGYILRLEEPMDVSNISLLIKANLFDPRNIHALNQEQANYRVAIFRDEILELNEYQERVFGHNNH